MMILAVYCKKGVEMMCNAMRHCDMGLGKDRDLPDQLTSYKILQKLFCTTMRKF
jgi:hypothetical protein